MKNNINTAIITSETPIPDKHQRSPSTDTLPTPREPNLKSYKRLKKISDIANTTNIYNRTDNNMIIISNNEPLEPQYPDIKN